jgi:hypothetical protein
MLHLSIATQLKIRYDGYEYTSLAFSHSVERGLLVTCVIPEDIERQLSARAAVRQTTVDQLVVEALSWYLSADDELLEELAAWQRGRDEAASLVEGQDP